MDCYLPGVLSIKPDSTVGSNDESEALVKPPVVACAMQHGPGVVVELAWIFLKPKVKVKSQGQQSKSKVKVKSQRLISGSLILTLIFMVAVSGLPALRVLHNLVKNYSRSLGEFVRLLKNSCITVANVGMTWDIIMEREETKAMANNLEQVWRSHRIIEMLLFI